MFTGEGERKIKDVNPLLNSRGMALMGVSKWDIYTVFEESGGVIHFQIHILQPNRFTKCGQKSYNRRTQVGGTYSCN